MSTLFWFPTFGIQAVLLIRALRDKRLLRYRFFYLYVLSAFLADGFILFAYAHLPDASYSKIYWAVEFATDLLTCGILYEVAARIFSNEPEAAGFAKLTRITMRLIAVCFTGLFVFRHLVPALGQIVGDFEFARWMLDAQAGFLIMTIWGILFLGMPVGKNAKGLILGFGIQIGGMVPIFATASFFLRFYERFGQSLIMILSYVALITWLASLWDYDPDPLPDRELVKREFHEALRNGFHQFKEFAHAFLSAPFKLRSPL